MRRLALLLALSPAALFAWPNPAGNCFISTPSALAPATDGIDYSVSINTTGCGSIRLVEIATGSLPPGLTLSSPNATITGKPTSPGRYAFSVRVVSEFLDIASAPFTIIVNPPVTIRNPALASATAGVDYAEQIRVTGGTGPLLYEVVPSNGLPSGLTLQSSTGLITGAPSGPATTFRIRVTDTNGDVAEKSFTIVMQASQITTASIPSTASVGTAYAGADIDSNLSATGFSLVLGSLPPGLTMNSSGQISGTPAAAGDFYFTVRCTSGLTSVWRSYRIAVNTAAAVTGNPRQAMRTFAYDHVFSVTGGVEPYTFSVASGALPSGVTLNSSTGALVGEVPLATGAGPFTFGINAVDANGRTYTGSFSITTVAPISPSTSPTPPAVRAGVTGNATPYGTINAVVPTYRFLSGAGRNELTINPTNGQVSYNFPAAGSFASSAIVSDSLGGAVRLLATYNVFDNLRFITTALPNIPTAAAAAPPPITLQTANGAAPVTFQVISGSIPTGMSFSSTGVLSGGPTASGTFSFTVRATDAVGQTADQAYIVGTKASPVITSSVLLSGTSNTAYPNTQLQWSGGGGTWSLISGSLPVGLSLSPSGLITGTPTVPGTFTFTVGATLAPAGVGSDTKQLTIVVANPLTFTMTPPGTLAGVRGVNSIAAVNVSGGRGPYTVTANVSAGLPEGFYERSSAPLGVGGTSEVLYSEVMAILVSDVDGRNANTSYIVSIADPVVITTDTLPPGTRTVPYVNTTLSIAGGVSPYTTLVTAGTLPTGLTLNSSGVFSGTPTVNGTFNFTVTATDGQGRTGSRDYAISVADALTNTSPTTLPGGSVLGAYNQTLTVTGGSTPPVFEIVGGNVPPLTELNLDTGNISNLPLLTGTFSFTVRATDGDGRFVDKLHQITISSISITTLTLPNGTTGTTYSQSIGTSGGVAPLTFSVSAGALPGGLVLNPSTGAITGTPTVAGTFNFTVQVIDGATASAAQAYTVIVSNPLLITTTTLPAGAISTPYSATVVTSGGRAPLSFALGAGTLPTGVTLNQASGAISGTPTVSGAFSPRIDVTDADGRTANRTFALNISGSSLTVNPATIPNGTTGTPYSVTFTTSVPSGVVWSVASGTLPTGLALNPSSGALTGTPSAAGTFNFVIDASVAATLQSGQRSYTVIVSDPLTISTLTLPNGTVNNPYSATVLTSGGRGPMTFSLGAGTLPAGVTLNSGSGLISGTPTASGTFTPRIDVIDADGRTANRTYSFDIAVATLTIGPATLPTGTIGSAYSATFTTTASSTVTWSVASGALPTGLTLNPASGVLSGSPSAAGTFNFTIAATASATAQSGQRTYTVDILNVFSISTATLPDGMVGETYNVTLAAAGAAGSVTWAITAGSLPPGLTLNPATGVIGVTPADHMLSAITVSATDQQGRVAARSLSIRIHPALVIVNGLLGDVPRNSSFSLILTGAGGVPPYTWSLVGTGLPSGIGLALNGLVSGSASSAEGIYAQQFRLTDARGGTVVKTLTMTITAPAAGALEIVPTSFPKGTVGQAYSAGVSANGGTPGYSFSLVSGSLPPGLSFTGSSVSGTPTTAGSWSFSINVTDAAGRVAGNLYTIVVDPAVLPLTVTPETIGTPQLGQAFSASFGASGGKPPYSFSIGGNLPPGLSGNSSGLLSGTPSAAGNFSATVTVTDSAGATAAKTYALNVAGTLQITTQPPLAEGTVGVAYSASFAASGGRAPYRWSLTGSTPAGTSFDAAAATLAGTPTAAGNSSFTVEVRDAAGQVATAGFSVRIYDRLEIISGPGTLPVPVGQAFSSGFGTRGGKPPVVFAVLSGALPGGVSLDSGGTLSGTPTTAGSFPFTVEATDALNNKAQRAATITIASNLLVTTASLPNGTVGVAYSAGVAASGGVPPLGTWSVSAGALPAGLSMAGDGAITGTPTAAGNASFTVRITDSTGTAATRALSIAIGLPPVPPPSFAGLPSVLPPGQQTNIVLRLADPFPVPVTGTLTLTFVPNAVANADDPSVQFSTGGRSVTFTFPAGQTNATFPADPLRILSGTVAGAIRISTSTQPPSANPVPDQIITINRGVPVITSSSVQLGANQFTIVLDGFSNTREVSSAVIRLNPTPGALLQTNEVQINLAAVFTPFYQSSTLGGLFRLSIPLNVQGTLNDIESVTVTISNSVGASQPVTIRLR
ncbi:MAG: hypothetical protein FJW30_02985 [Acidobacteria bacterium]|nr:hypothetical protein [Acidobacteriota bacterium]